jgi:aldose sugar dehydrogenase
MKRCCRVLASVAWCVLGLSVVPAIAAAGAAPSVAAWVVQTEKYQLSVHPVVQGLSRPWSLAFLPDGRMLVTEKAGQLRLVDHDFRLHPKPIAGLPEVFDRGQGGLFDVVLHPDYARNGWIYWAYNQAGEGGWGTAMARGKLRGHELVDVQVLFSMQPKTRTGQHFGGRIAFDGLGFVYLTLGDRGDMARAQRPDDHAGAVIRLHDDGRVPQDNPWFGQTGAMPESWTRGHRNIQGAAFHPQTGALWTHEHGPQGGDEVNVTQAGRNYGWPVITKGVNYGSGTPIGEGESKPGMEQPLHTWVPSIAPSGMTFVTGAPWTRWRNNLLVGALRGQALVRLELSGQQITHEERILQAQVGRIRDVRTGPDGLIYVLTDDTDGALLRLAPIDP